VRKRKGVQKLLHGQTLFGLDIFRRPTFDAVNKWTFKPYLVNGEPTRVATFITITFKLT
jgi:hypothetical protein